MNKKIYLLSLFSLFLLLPHTSYADCTAEEIEHFKEVENEYKITYEFNEDTKDYTLTTNAPLPNEYDFVLYIGKNTKYEEITPNQYKIYNLSAGEYNVEIVGVTDTCNSVLKKITLKLAEYNNYSNDPLCEGIEEFVLCQPTYDKSITYQEFVDRVNVYKKTKAQKEKAEENKNKVSNSVIEYIEKNLFEIIAVAVFVLILIIIAIITIKTVRKSRRLE